MFKIKNLTTGYHKKPVIKNLSFTLEAGDVLCIIGPNGCGKSTLLKALSNIIDYDGSVTYGEYNLQQLHSKNLAKIIGLLLQSNNVNFSYTIYESVAMGDYANNQGLLQVKEDRTKVLQALAAFELLQEQNLKIDEISGGQYQRMKIARLFIQNPKIMMLDEPTNHLDLKHQAQILELITTRIKQEKQIGIIVMHDLTLVNKFANKVLLLDNNYNYYFGEPKEILNNENINNVYGIDVKKWMNNLYELWK